MIKFPDILLLSIENNSYLKVVDNTYIQVKELLTDAGLKATHPRIAILHELMVRDEHPTAEQLHDRIKAQNPSISLGSVYRILEKLVESNLVSRVATRSGTKRYDANLEQHSHIYSMNTEEIQDYHDEELNRLIREYFQNKQVKNFRITDIKLQINGEKEDPNEEVTIV